MLQIERPQPEPRIEDIPPGHLFGYENEQTRPARIQQVGLKLEGGQYVWLGMGSKHAASGKINNAGPYMGKVTPLGPCRIVNTLD